LGQFHQHFWCQSRAAFEKIILGFLMAKVFSKSGPKYGPRCKSCSLKYALKLSRNIGETEQHILVLFTLCQFFASCANWLVKLTQAWKSAAVTNTPAYRGKVLLNSVKSFIIHTAG
jgi:hypothetical protein